MVMKKEHREIAEDSSWFFGGEVPKSVQEVFDAYLAEHPEDENELITNEWLEAAYPSKVFQLDQATQLTVWIDSRRGLEVFVSKIDSDSVWRSTGLPNIKTRGQLRQLIKLLKGAE